ncbi:MAG: acyl-CoA/acyl-ACP dehydrogenase [Rhodospirillaceae bacterium]|jgi:alkylation response protein AidB-like acyl-CoA dehydrogenase|nr:acyl-CoA/acyl-ACP dehydrogenase [Rhodospirillaceae bacterium]MBT5191672.1 acyl-CoA/acyl-ACP dehydrogenase [Rhodospirillaceae bacterium]MBT5895022.1 acyl-CoA/acyl-ACP dehydrogenase [Rhodospirillaceae bacterium]
MYFADEPEHITMLRDSLRRFTEQEAPRERRQEWQAAQTWPRDVFAKLAELGVCGLTVAEEFGGQGQDWYAATAVIEELSRAGTYLCGPFIQCAFYGGGNISESGSPAQKTELLPKIAAGELHFAYGLSEPDTGGDLANVKTRAHLEDDGHTVVINGTKRWCTGADWADYIFCFVNSDPDGEKYRNLSMILVPTDAPGITRQQLSHRNLVYSHSFDVYFDDVRLPAENILGGPDAWNQGWRGLAGRSLDVEKIEVAAMTFGLAQAAVEEAWEYAQQRRQFGKVISGHQAVRHELVEARTKLEACRHMLYHAAWLVDQGRPASVETSMAKLFVADVGVEIGMACQRILGAYGLSEEFDMAQTVMDLIGMPIVGGSSHMQKNNIANRLGLAG